MLGALFLFLLALILVPGVAAPQEAESGEPPAFGNATRGNATTIVLTITDDVDVDESSITAADFSLSPGSLERIGVNESGNDTTVRLYMSSVVNRANVTVSLTDGGSIADTEGNRRTTDSVVVTGMDGFGPQLRDFEIDRVNETTANVTVVSSEGLSELYVGVGGPDSRTLTIENFTAIDTPASFEYPYRTTIEFDEDAEYDLLLGTMIDENGEETRYNVERTYLVDRMPPDPAIDAPASVEAGEPITLGGNGSTDEFGVAGYEWSLGTNESATGATAEHTFERPGYNPVTLTVRDRRNNTASRTVPVYVESATTTDDVATTSNDTGVSATVGPNRTAERVRIERDGSLANASGVRLESLTVDVPRNESASLDFTGHRDVPDSFDDANATTLAGIEVTHDRSLSRPTFRFSVNETTVEEAGLTASDVQFYRETDDWQHVYTARVDERDGRIIYEATAAGLSQFVIGGPGGETAETAPDPDTEGDGTDGESSGVDESSAVDSSTGSASILVANSTLVTDAIDPGDRAIVRAVARNSGNATGTAVVGLVVNNSVVTTEPVTVPAGENRTVTFVERLSAGGSVVVNGTIAGTLAVGENGTVATAGGGGLPIPNPLALWPGGLFGRVLGAVFWFLAITYAVLKGLAIYLGY